MAGDILTQILARIPHSINYKVSPVAMFSMLEWLLEFFMRIPQ